MYIILQPYGRRVFFDIAGVDTLYRVFEAQNKKEADEILKRLDKYGYKATVYRTTGWHKSPV